MTDELSRLAIKAKTSGSSLEKLLKKTVGYRRRWVYKFPRASNIIKDLDGDLIALTWEAVRRYDPERGVRFNTLLLSMFNNNVSQEWIRRVRRRKVKFRRLCDILDSKRISVDDSVIDSLHLEDVLNNFLFGVEKLVYARTIITVGKISVLAGELGIPIYRLRQAKRNLKLFANIVFRDDKIAELFLQTIKLRGLCDEVTMDKGDNM